MKITHWWPLAFVLLIPVIIIMYMLKQKAKQEKVPSLFLWQEMIRNDRANTPWEKLKKNWLMILQIITLIVLIIALMSPYFLSAMVGSGKACVVIDTSASMNFMYDDNQTRIDKAKEEAVSFVRKLRSGTEISLITSDRNAMLLASKSQSKSEVIEMINNITASNYSGDANEGVEMATALAMDSKGLQTLIITDSTVDCENLEATVVDVYSDRENIAIDYVSHGFKNNELSILVKVSNYGESTVKKDVSLYEGERLVANKEVEIEGKDSTVVYFENVEIQGGVYFAQISGKDANELDNISYDVLSEENENSVLLMTQANIYLEKALELIPGINVTKSEDIESFDDFASRQYDLYIFDSMLPANLPSQGNIIVFNQQCDSIAPVEDVCNNIIVKGVECSTTKYLDGMSFGVSETYAYKVPDNGQAFLASEVYDDEGNAHTKNIGVITENQGRTYAIIGFNLHNSDFPLYMEYPLLMYNLVNECVKSGMLTTYVYEGGDSVTISANVDESLPSITKPDGEVIELSDYRYNFTDTDEFGVYSVKQELKNGEAENTFAVNFPSSESKIETHPSMMVSGDEKVVTEVKGVFNLRNFIIILALLLLCVEWIASLRK